MSLFKSLFAKKPETPVMSHGEARVQKMHARIDAMRADSFKRDESIRGEEKISSGEAEGASEYGTSVGRLKAGGAATLPPKLPPIGQR